MPYFAIIFVKRPKQKKAVTANATNVCKSDKINLTILTILHKNKNQMFLSTADSSDGRTGDCGSKGQGFKPRKGPSLRIENNKTLQLM